MRKLIFLIILCFTFNSFAGKSRGGVHDEITTKKEIILLLSSGALKNAMLNYLKTLGPNSLAANTEDNNFVRNAFIRMMANDGLQKDILTPNNYTAKNICHDQYGSSSEGDALFGDVGGKICFNVTTLAKEYKNLSREDRLIKLASLAFHEHVHHFQNEQIDMNANENEAYLVSTYVQMTAKVTFVDNSRVLEFVDQFGFLSVCKRSAGVRFSLLKAFDTDDCNDITKNDLNNLTDLKLELKNSEPLKNNDLTDLISLVKLDMSGNSLTELPLDLFQDLQRTKILILSNNNLSTISFKAILDLNKLVYLDLSKNEFKNIPVYLQMRKDMGLRINLDNNPL